MRKHMIVCDRCNTEAAMLTGDEEETEPAEPKQLFDLAAASRILRFCYGGPQHPDDWSRVTPPNGKGEMDVCWKCTAALRAETDAAFLRWMESK